MAKQVAAQQEPQFSQYMFNELYNNPAYAGVEGVTNLQAIYRNQWLGYSGTFDEGGSPITQVISFNTPIFRFRSGAGFQVVNDNIANQNTKQIMAFYAYHLGVFDGKMSFGIKGGLATQTIDWDDYRYVDPDDPLIQNGKESQMRPDLGFGVYYKAEKYFGGISLNHILKSKFDFDSDNLRNALENHMYISGGYRYELNYDVILTPSALIKTDFKTYAFDVSIVGTYREKFWGGLSYRQSEAVAALIGANVFKDNSLKIGYSIDYVISAQKAKKATSHEIMLSYNMPAITGGGKKVVRTPRFRH